FTGHLSDRAIRHRNQQEVELRGGGLESCRRNRDAKTSSDRASPSRRAAVDGNAAGSGPDPGGGQADSQLPWSDEDESEPSHRTLRSRSSKRAKSGGRGA